MPLSTTYEYSSGPNTIDGELLGRNTTSKAGFYGAVPVVKPTVTGAKGGNAALTSLIAALVAQGLITDTTS